MCGMPIGSWGHGRPELGEGADYFYETANVCLKMIAATRFAPVLHGQVAGEQLRPILFLSNGSIPLGAVQGVSPPSGGYGRGSFGGSILQD